MARKNPDPDATRAAICSTAASLFMQNGVHATSLQDIARDVKLSKGTLYYHYPTKEKLVNEIANAHLSYITSVIYAWVEELDRDLPALEALEPLSDMLLRERSWVRLHFALLSEAMREEGALLELFNIKQREWAVILEVGSLRLTGAGAQRFKMHCRDYIPLLYGYAMHMLTDGEEIDNTLLNRLIAQ